MESRAKRIRVNTILFICLAILLFCLCLPFISMLGTSVKTRDAALSTWSLFPQTWTDFSLESYATVMTKTNFPMNILNTVVVCACVVVVCITVASMAGYAISRYKGAYFKGYSILLLMLQMFPTMLLLMPLYVTYTKLRLINTLWSVIISYSTMNLAFSIWMLKGFFDTIPTELEEAAVVDGCTRFFAFIRVILPLSLPGIATVAIFTILNAWNEYTLGSIFLRRNDVMTITIGLQKFVGQNSTDWPSLMTAATIATIPTALFMLFAQRFLIEGMTAGAVKG